MTELPELLAPAGSPAAFDAALEAGADAVYFGGSSFNARMGAANFDADSMRTSVSRAHAYGVKCYVTLNTLVTDRELCDCLRAAAEAYEAGADGLIVADIGVAAAVHAYLPDLALHASTQASGHNTNAAAEFRKLGFSRMVMAREATLGDIRSFTHSAGMELEVFVHGALCVSHSGQCLFSSLVGGRSGNRGECAQPCRLPYTKNGSEYYPLSLKDLCLARYVPELIEAGVSSLKIEGRMKPPEYVYAVTSVWRRLLDERRAADDGEMKYLAGIFSRAGFTDGYFTGRITRSMLGVRSEDNKNSTRSLTPFAGLTRRVPLAMTATFVSGEPSRLEVSDGRKTVTVTGDVPKTAISAPMTADDYRRCLAKLGGTPYEAENIKINAQPGLMLPVSRLNALRRSATAALYGEPRGAAEKAPPPATPSGIRGSLQTAVFSSPEQITGKARGYFDRLYLPLDRFDGETDAVIMPPVVFDREAYETEKLLVRAKALGASHILVGNVGHIAPALKHGFTVHGDFRLNVTNSTGAAALERLGIGDFVLSPELTLPQLRDIEGDTSAIVYGRIPLMLLEKCAVCEISGCRGRDGSQLCHAALVDRRGAEFPVVREGEHRNVVLNSIVTCMSDRQDELFRNGITARHFIFTGETAAEVDRVVSAFENRLALPFPVRRIGR